MKLLIVLVDFFDLISDGFVLLLYLSLQYLDLFSMIFFNLFVIGLYTCLDFDDLFVCLLELICHCLVLKLQVLVERCQFCL